MVVCGHCGHANPKPKNLERDLWERFEYDVSNRGSNVEVSNKDEDSVNPFHCARSHASSEWLHLTPVTCEIMVSNTSTTSRWTFQNLKEECNPIPNHHKVKLVAIKLRKHASIWWEHHKKQCERERKSRIVT